MKTKLFILTICVALANFGVSAKISDSKTLSGNSLTEFGKYSITVSENAMLINSNPVKTFELTYENADAPVQIGLIREKECVTYLVRSDEFEIQYTSKKGSFGVERISHKYQTLPKKEVTAKLSKNNFLSQKILSSNELSTDQHLGLIACFLPQLTNENAMAGF